jgi:uncharacterized protein YndB with AHSA1/START domain
MIRIADEFLVAAPPDEVFAFMVDPGNLAKWQTIKTAATPLTDGPPRLGYRLREASRVGLRSWEQTVEFTEFDSGRAFAVRVVEGPPSGGRWVMEPRGSGTRVRFEAEFAAPRVLAWVIRPLIARQFRGFHQTLRGELWRMRNECGMPAPIEAE